eukprot:g5137.t1
MVQGRDLTTQIVTLATTAKFRIADAYEIDRSPTVVETKTTAAKHAKGAQRTVCAEEGNIYRKTINNQNIWFSGDDVSDRPCEEKVTVEYTREMLGIYIYAYSVDGSSSGNMRGEVHYSFGRIEDNTICGSSGSHTSCKSCSTFQCSSGAPYCDGSNVVQCSCAGNNAVVSSGSASCPNTLPGSACTSVSCNTGYEINSWPRCQSNLNWASGSCRKKKCTREPSHIGNMRSASCQNREYLYSCSSYTCNDGYDRSGNTQCKRPGTTNEWDGGSCNPKPCPNNPTGIANMDTSGTDCRGTRHNARCTVRCNRGYTASMSPKCELGNWEGGTRCNEDACASSLGSAQIQNLAAGCSANQNAGTRCTLRCNSGYTPSDTATCRRGSWVGTSSGDELPECSPNGCDATLPSWLTNTQGSQVINCRDRSHGQQCDYLCASGYRIQGTGKLRCSAGSWLSSGSSVESCRDIDECSERRMCNGQGDCVNSAGSYSCVCGANFYGTDCEGRYNDCANSPCNSAGGVCVNLERTSVGQVNFRCNCYSGWTGTRCESVESCPPFNFPEGVVGRDGRSAAFSNGIPLRSNSSCSIHCEDGYDFSGHDYVKCDDGRFGSNFRCSARPCERYPAIANMDHSGSRCLGTASGQKCASITCDAGYSLQPSSYSGPVCRLGQWTSTSQDATCTANACEGARVPNSNYENALITGTTGTRVRVTCETGYEIDAGDGFAVCGTDGRFRLPVCRAKRCTSTQVPNSNYDRSGSIQGTTGESVAVTCNDGYADQSGSRAGTATCGTNGQFSVPTCSANRCDDASVEHSNTPIAGTTGTRVQVSCNAGYEIASGDGVAICGTDGVFRLPTCRAKRCAATQVSNSNYETSESIQGTTGDSVTVTCHDGYAMEGGAVRGPATCGTNSQFTVPTCSANSCQDAYVSNSNYEHTPVTGSTGSRVRITCNAGYEIESGDGFAICDTA